MIPELTLAGLIFKFTLIPLCKPIPSISILSFESFLIYFIHLSALYKITVNELKQQMFLKITIFI